LILFVAVSGCRGPLVNAKGRLTYKGQPVPSTYVFFWPEEEGKRRSTGLTDDDGHFTLSYSRTEPGVLLGKHSVALRYYVSPEEEQQQIQPKASAELKAIIAQFHDPKASRLQFEVTHNGQFIDVRIE
jgi:hypothetical protein